jgi:hypothetical protein
MGASGLQFYTICKDCLLFTSSGFFLAYGMLVLLASIAPIKKLALQKTKNARQSSRQPPMIGELGAITVPRFSISSLILQQILFGRYF